MNVPTPIDPSLKAFALARAAPVPADALAQVEGCEHLLTHSGFIAQIAHMAGVPSLSPTESAHMAMISRGLDEALDSLDPEVRAHVAGPLGEYRAALCLLSEIGFFTSSFLVAYLKQEMIDRPLAAELGVELGQLDMTVKLLKLGGRNSDGTPWVTGEAWR